MMECTVSKQVLVSMVTCSNSQAGAGLDIGLATCVSQITWKCSGIPACHHSRWSGQPLSDTLSSFFSTTHEHGCPWGTLHLLQNCLKLRVCVHGGIGHGGIEHGSIGHGASTVTSCGSRPNSFTRAPVSDSTNRKLPPLPPTRE